MTTGALEIDAVEALGDQLGRELPNRAVVWLDGPLGAGKTTLARAIVRGRGVRAEATSPTFGLVHHYDGPRGPIYHVDCYRLRDPEEAADFDWESLMAADLLLIEWPERAGPWAPPPTTHVRLGHAGDDRRSVDVA
jgi:tRNA threonylcarbamoyladenosine biosynthesis protein TsaE